jgi:drug/metabolite transporter (DMT)-like permease
MLQRLWPLLLLCAAATEVGSDAIIRRALRQQSAPLVLLGAAALGAYGIVLNLVQWDFSRLLGVYVAFFAVIGVIVGWLCFGERVPATTWAGLALIVAGGAVIQSGQG